MAESNLSFIRISHTVRLYGLVKVENFKHTKFIILNISAKFHGQGLVVSIFSIREAIAPLLASFSSGQLPY